MYVDPALPPASKADVTAAPSPQPVQFVYEFQTKGLPNARVTESTRERALEVAKGAGLFSLVSNEPQANGRRLTVVINNFPQTDDAASKGLGVGLTFGLFGTVLTDGYDTRAALAVPGAETVTLQYKHTLYTAIGNVAPPQGLTPEPSIPDAINKLIDQLMWSVMSDVSKSGRL
jgi:hypothetical protein